MTFNVILLFVVILAICIALAVSRSAEALDALAIYCAARASALRAFAREFTQAKESEENLRRNIADTFTVARISEKVQPPAA